MMDFLRLGEARIQQINAAMRKSPACEDRSLERTGVGAEGFRWQKKQGRRRSITLTALPAPDIEIGLRHPVNCSLARNRADDCDPFHKSEQKLLPIRRRPYFGAIPVSRGLTKAAI
jgi:hypothetical protein